MHIRTNIHTHISLSIGRIPYTTPPLIFRPSEYFIVTQLSISIDATLVIALQHPSMLQLQNITNFNLSQKENLRRAQQGITYLEKYSQTRAGIQGGKHCLFMWMRVSSTLYTHSQATKKLSKRLYETFRISKRIEGVAYRLDLPIGSMVHHMFHILLLWQAYVNTTPRSLPIIQEIEEYSKPVTQPLVSLHYITGLSRLAFQGYIIIHVWILWRHPCSLSIILLHRQLCNGARWRDHC